MNATQALSANSATPAQLFSFDAATIPLHQAKDLTNGGTQARILLNGQVYDLRITRAGKLILTK